MSIQPYLFFNGHTQQAIDFYSSALGAEVVMMMRFDQHPDGAPPNTRPDAIMHASVRIGDAVMMMSDGMGADAPSFSGFALSLSPPDAEAARRVFDTLAEGGSVTMPLQKTFWASSFGILKDRFGVSWMINVEA